MRSVPAAVVPIVAAWLSIACASPALAAAGDEPAATRSPRALAGWGLALLTLSAIGWAASSRSGPDRERRRAERERIARLMADLERAQRERLAERARTGLRRPPRAASAPSRRPQASSFEGGFSFQARPPVLGRPPASRPREQERAAADLAVDAGGRDAREETPPASSPACAAAESAADEASSPTPPEGRRVAASRRLERLLEAIDAAERRLAAIDAQVEAARARVKQDAPGPEAAGRTLDLGPPELPAPDLDLDVGVFDEVPDRLLERLGGLGELRSGTVDLGPLELPGGETLDLGTIEVPDHLLERLRALSDGVRELRGDRTLDLGAPELPVHAQDDELAPDTLVAVPDDLLARLRALADMAVPDGSFTPVIAPSPPRPPVRAGARRDASPATHG